MNAQMKAYSRGFFSLQAPKLKAKKTQTQGNFPKNSRKFLQKLINPENFKIFFCHFYLKIKNFAPILTKASSSGQKNHSKLRIFTSKTQEIPRNSRKFSKNSSKII